MGLATNADTAIEVGSIEALRAAAEKLYGQFGNIPVLIEFYGGLQTQESIQQSSMAEDVSLLRSDQVPTFRRACICALFRT